MTAVPSETRIDQRIDEIRERLAGRRLIWFGIRGEDGEALLSLPELDASYAVTAPLRSASVPRGSNVTLEEITGRRPDLDRPDIDHELEAGSGADAFRRRLLREVSERCVVMTYRPTALVTALAFSMAETMTLAGLDRDRQLIFENKPWVERALGARGVRGLGWRYVADEHRSRVKRMLARGPHVLRASRASGGVGIVPVETERDIGRYWPSQPEAFVAVAPFLADAIPVNFSGCVFADGTARLHPPSVQLIGIHSCTDRPFGYCGNDFAAPFQLGDSVLSELDGLGRSVAEWLHEERYRGAFGVDALVHNGRVYFTEVNPRFQGSSALSAELASRLDVPDLFLDHLAATLGVPASPSELSLLDWAHEQAPVSRVVVHNTGSQPLQHRGVAAMPARSPDFQVGQLARDASVDPGGTLFCLTFPRAVTRTGFSLNDETASLVAAVSGSFALQPTEPAVVS